MPTQNYLTQNRMASLILFKTKIIWIWRALSPIYISFNFSQNIKFLNWKANTIHCHFCNKEYCAQSVVFRLYLNWIAYLNLQLKQPHPVLCNKNANRFIPVYFCKSSNEIKIIIYSYLAESDNFFETIFKISPINLPLSAAT